MSDYPSIRVLIADPDAESRDDIESAIRHAGQFELLDHCEDGQSAIRAIESAHPDFVFIETELPDMSGFCVLQETQPNHQTRFIFVTSNALQALTAFEYHAFDYLMKPLNRGRINLALIKAQKEFESCSSLRLQDKLNALFRYVHMHDRNPPNPYAQPRLIPVKNGSRIRFVLADDIEYIVASGYYIEIFSDGRKHLVRETLKEMDDRLRGLGFIRIHRSVVINLRHLREIRKSNANDFSVQMSDGELFKISKSYKAEVFNLVGLG